MKGAFVEAPSRLWTALCAITVLPLVLRSPLFFSRPGPRIVAIYSYDQLLGQ